MTNIVGMNEFAPMPNGDANCWLCQKAVTVRALFCHHCGTVQPVRNIDHFARLGLERRIDVDMTLLDHQYAALVRTLDPQRFLIRGLGERGYAAKQLEALAEAYATLSDPLRRGRYWMSLHVDEAAKAAATAPMVAELRRELDVALEPSHCDRVAQRAGQALETGIMSLMQALRSENWGQANQALCELDGLESVLADVRTRRAFLAGATR